MGMFDSVLARLGGQQGTDGGVQSLTRLLGDNGGIQGIMAKLSATGASQQVQSWVGHGDNKPVTGAQLRRALDRDSLGRLARQAGITPEQASDQIARILPSVIDTSTPHGQVPPQGEDPLARGMGAMQGLISRL